ncbi:DUF2061 domain-containing protein [Pseudorhodobacter ferrugineus]|uniref:DUF2061 domain-containing protein n=1 Tax=Pseudorhodobacter ferrugineus TaxID=77008 RepID=UPI0003B42039|nr:DUF2061 domain-containing protein [Pseudorhodobacter ferrugineus]
METRSRSLVKAFVWQGLGLISMIAIGWFVTGSFGLAGGLAVANVSVGFVAYLLHERVWAQITWGKKTVE